MAATASAAARRRGTARRASGGRSRRPSGPGIRWDRVGRIALLLVLGLILALYIGPLHSYLTTWQKSKQRKAEVTRLEAERSRLLDRKRELERAVTLERAARSLGMVKPGERPYVVASPAS